MFLPYYIGNGVWIKGQGKGNRDIRGVKGKGRNQLKEKRKREEEKKRGRGKRGQKGSRLQAKLLLDAECDSLFRLKEWVFFFSLLLDC